jgi:hypothetical protein
MEGRELAKGNAVEADARRTQSRERATHGLERVRQAATKDKKQRFTALLHMSTTSTTSVRRTRPSGGTRRRASTA